MKQQRGIGHLLVGLTLCLGLLLTESRSSAAEPVGPNQPNKAVQPNKPEQGDKAGLGKAEMDRAEMDKTVQELAALAKKSVVVVTFRGRDGERQGLGAGFLFDPNGLIATNLHVIGDARPISVELADGRKFDVKAVHATERSQDLAILKIDATDLPALPLGNSDELQEGQPVVAIGNPVGLERSVVSGVLSGRREIDGRAMLQVALPIERGNSGGPLLDLRGRVHGLLTLKSLKTENLGFAVPVNALKPLIAKPNPIPISRWLTIGVLDPEEWTVLPGGRWRQRSGRVLVDGQGAGIGGRALCLATEPAPSVPYELAVQVKFDPPDGAAGLVFHADGKDRHYGFYPSNGGLRLSRFDGSDVFAWKVLREVKSPHLNKSGWNDLKVRIEKDRFRCFVNDQLVIECEDTELKEGRVGLCKFRQTEAEFKSFRAADVIPARQIPKETTDRVASLVGELTLGAARPPTVSKNQVERIAGDGTGGIKALEEAAERLEKQAKLVRQLAERVHLKRTLAEFQTVVSVKDKPLDLLRAGLLISRLDNPELDVDAYVKEVERHARRVQADLDQAFIHRKPIESEKLAALNRYLFEEQGFHGSRTDYDNRSNSYLNEVLDDREGLPITLSVLYIEIARRVGLNVVGVGMPRHFLVRHEPTAAGQDDVPADATKPDVPGAVNPTKPRSPAGQIVDVYDRGQLLTPAAARRLFESLSETAWRDEYLNTSSSKSILERMLQNLIGKEETLRDMDRMFRYTSAFLLVSPDAGQMHLYRAAAAFQTQRWDDTREEIEWLETRNSEVDPRQIEGLRKALSQEAPR